MKLACLLIGGVFGTVSRHWLSGAIHEQVGNGFPYGTLAVNAIGCFIAGLLSMSGQGSFQLSPEAKLALMTGFCGAFTTFSALILESSQLTRNNQNWQALGNVSLSLLIGFTAFFIGTRLGGRI